MRAMKILPELESHAVTAQCSKVASLTTQTLAKIAASADQ